MDTPKRARNAGSNIFLGIFFLAIIVSWGCQATPWKQATPSPVVTQTPPWTPTPQTSLLLSVDEVRERWLSGTPCLPPCWEGVIPGETTAAEAVQILNSNPLFSQIEVAHSKLPGVTTGFINFEFPYLDGQGNFETLSGDMRFDYTSRDQIIHRIQWSFPAIRLGELIQAFGEPSHIGALFDDGRSAAYWVLYVVWMPQGLQVWEENFEPTPGKIDANTQLTSVNYFQPGIENYANAFEGWWADGLRPWQGYADFTTYKTTPIPLP